MSQMQMMQKRQEKNVGIHYAFTTKPALIRPGSTFIILFEEDIIIAQINAHDRFMGFLMTI